MTANRDSKPADLRIVEGVSPARLHGQACIGCGAVNVRLTPAGTVGTRISEDLVREWDVVSCRACLKPA